MAGVSFIKGQLSVVGCSLQKAFLPVCLKPKPDNLSGKNKSTDKEQLTTDKKSPIYSLPL